MTRITTGATPRAAGGQEGTSCCADCAKAHVGAMNIISAQAEKVKALKAAGKDNKDPEVVAAVTVLQELKAAASGGGGGAAPAKPGKPGGGGKKESSVKVRPF